MQNPDPPTPSLIIDGAALDRNIATMARFARDRGLALRPHAKTHKCAAIARRQIAAGAVGICCAKLGEAEALGKAGIGSILVTTPIVGVDAIERLASLHAQLQDLAVVVDHPSMVAHLARAATPAKPLAVFIDIDPGMQRTGVATCKAAIELAAMVQATPAISYAGVQYYCGAEQHIESYAHRRTVLSQRMERLAEMIAALAAAELVPEVITGGGTGSHRIDAELGILTELQPGSYIFMDGQYDACALAPDFAPFENSLEVEARIISANHAGLATVDAGTKALSTEGPTPKVLSGVPSGARYRFMGDEHGIITLSSGSELARLGTRVRLSVPHCDPTVNLYDRFHVRDETQWSVWPIEGRGCSY